MMVPNYFIIIIIIIIICYCFVVVVTFIQSMYNYLPETNHVSVVHIVVDIFFFLPLHNP